MKTVWSAALSWGVCRGSLQRHLFTFKESSTSVELCSHLQPVLCQLNTNIQSKCDRSHLGKTQEQECKENMNRASFSFVPFRYCQMNNLPLEETSSPQPPPTSPSVGCFVLLIYFKNPRQLSTEITQKCGRVDHL